MEERTKIHVGLDVHKDSISVAAAEPGRGPARLIGKVAHDVNKLLKVLAKIGSAGQLHIVYEAGPTGFGLQRALKDTCSATTASASRPPRSKKHRAHHKLTKATVDGCQRIQVPVKPRRVRLPLGGSCHLRLLSWFKSPVSKAVGGDRPVVADGLNRSRGRRTGEACS